jgi:hypothetical protein
MATPCTPGHPVMHGQPLVQKGEVGIDNVADRQIAAQHVLEEELRLGDSGLGQGVVEIVVVVERADGVESSILRRSIQ